MTNDYKPKFYLTFIALVAILVTAGIYITHIRNEHTSVAAPTPTGKPVKLTHCPYDDGEIPKGYDGCIWDASSQGNKQGYSFIILADGTTYYADTYYQDGQPNSTSDFSPNKGYDPKDKYLQQSKYAKHQDAYHNCYNSKYGDWSHCTKQSSDVASEGDPYSKTKDSYHNCYSSKYHDYYHC